MCVVDARRTREKGKAQGKAVMAVAYWLGITRDGNTALIYPSFPL